MQLWPFLITRNQQRGFTHVVVPAFLKDCDALDCLRNALGDNRTEPNELLHLRTSHERLGAIDVLFRNVYATDRMLGGVEDVPLRDQFRRPIRMIEGVVLRGRLPGDESITASDMQAVRSSVQEAFARFWRSDGVGWKGPIPSSALESVGKQGGESMTVSLLDLHGNRVEALDRTSQESPLIRKGSSSPESVHEGQAASAALGSGTERASLKRSGRWLLFALVTGVAFGGYFLLKSTAARRGTRSEKQATDTESVPRGR